MSKESAAPRIVADLLHDRRRNARLTLLVLLAAGIACAWHWRAALDPAAIGHVTARSAAIAPLVFLGLHVIASLLIVPRTLFAAAAGLAFGVVWGTVWAALGSVLGAIAGFCIARYVESGFVKLQSIRAYRADLRSRGARGWRAVAGLRLIPVIPHALANYVLGLTPLRFAGYAFGSLLGQLPLTIVCVDLGAAGERWHWAAPVGLCRR